MLKWKWRNFKYAFNGLKIAFETQVNFRIQIFIAFVVVIAGFVFYLSILEWLLIILCIGLVLSFEAINTAVEEIVNFISPEYHPLAGKIKDLSAAAVLIIAVISAIIGCIIFIPKIILLF